MEKVSIIEVKDMNGTIMEKVYNNRLNDQVTINTNRWKPGIYISTLVVDGKPLESCKFTVIN